MKREGCVFIWGCMIGGQARWMWEFLNLIKEEIEMKKGLLF